MLVATFIVRRPLDDHTDILRDLFFQVHVGSWI